MNSSDPTAPPLPQQLRYAVLQVSLEIPPVPKLAAAFRSVPGLTAADAPGLANDAFGILVRNLNLDEATRLQEALQAQDIETEFVAESALPKLPPTKFVRRLDLGEDALVIYDAIGREVPVEWPQLALLAAGSVVMTEFTRRVVSTLPAPTFSRRRRGALGIVSSDDDLVVREVRTREQLAQRALLEIVLARALARFSIRVDDAPLLFQCLGEERTGNLTDDFARLVQRVASRTPRLLQNRGAFFLQQSPPTLFRYPSKNAFYEEITWMLWRAAKAGFAAEES